MFCPYCGNENVNEAAFCKECGKKLPSVEEKSNESQKDEKSANTRKTVSTGLSSIKDTFENKIWNNPTFEKICINCKPIYELVYIIVMVIFVFIFKEEGSTFWVILFSLGIIITLFDWVMAIYNKFFKKRNICPACGMKSNTDYCPKCGKQMKVQEVEKEVLSDEEVLSYKKKFCVLLAVIVVGVFVMLGASKEGDKYVLLVRYGSPLSYPNTTYDEAFGDYFVNPKWSYFKGENDEDVVVFKGKCTYLGEIVDVELQFVVNMKDEVFELEYCGVNDVPQMAFMSTALIEDVFESYEQ